MKAIYSRISTANQSHERQLTKKNDFDFVYCDVISGAVPFANRPEALNLLNNEKVNHITIKEITRLGRNLRDILNTLQTFSEKGVNIHIENLGLNTLLPDGSENPTANLMINLLGSIGQYERDLLKERTKEGRELAKIKKKYKGKPRGANAKIEEYIKKHKKDIDKVKLSFKNNNSITATAELTSVPRTRIYRFIKKGLVTPPQN